jgi:hypothetical protein
MASAAITALPSARAQQARLTHHVSGQFNFWGLIVPVGDAAAIAVRRDQDTRERRLDTGLLVHIAGIDGWIPPQLLKDEVTFAIGANDIADQQDPQPPGSQKHGHMRSFTAELILVRLRRRIAARRRQIRKMRHILDADGAVAKNVVLVAVIRHERSPVKQDDSVSPRRPHPVAAGAAER